MTISHPFTSAELTLFEDINDISTWVYCKRIERGMLVELPRAPLRLLLHPSFYLPCFLNAILKEGEIKNSDTQNIL